MEKHLSTAPAEALARELFESTTVGKAGPVDVLDELIRRATSDDLELARYTSRVFFRDIVERNCDLFDQAATQGYARLFAHTLQRISPEYSAAELLTRYQRLKQVRSYAGEPNRVCVLSRITLGADVAVTSVVLQAAKQRFPQSEICFAGPAKNAELFTSDPRVTRLPVVYGRSGLLRERVLASQALRQIVDVPGTLVIDPDSRLTQLGLIPICAEENYLFLESRAYGGNSEKTLGELTAEWLGETLGINDAAPYLAPLPAPPSADITVSLGVGENQEKLAGADLELRAIGKLVGLGAQVMIDRGAGGEEAARVDALVNELGRPGNLSVHAGSFAAFANQIAQSKLYFGYDSAGQHIAAASAVPLVSVFAGYAAERTYQRWKPTGRSPVHIIKIDRCAPASSTGIADRTLAAITLAAEEAGLS